MSFQIKAYIFIIILLEAYYKYAQFLFLSDAFSVYIENSINHR